MTADQIKEAKRLAGTMPREAIAEILGVSLSNLKRSCTGIKFNYFNRWAANPGFVKELLAYYEKHGRRKTEDKYPEANVKAIVERYKDFSPRQIKWKDSELIELAKFAGLISFKNQANFFNRPRANEGSIRSAWAKKFKTKPLFMHGLPIHKAKLFLEKGFPLIKRQSLVRDRYQNQMVLFCDAVNYIRKDCPEFVALAIKAMAEFQIKLYGDDPRLEIENIIEAFE